MTSILQDIADKSGMTREQLADAMNYTRQGLHIKLKKPKDWSVKDLERFAEIVGRSPRNLFSLIINN